MSVNESSTNQNIVLEIEYLNIVINSIICISSFTVNILLLRFVIKKCQNKPIASLIISSICITHIIISVTAVPTGLIAISPAEFTVLVLSCKFHKFSQSWSTISSIYIILLLSIYATSENFHGRVAFFLSFVCFFAASYSIWQILLYYPSTVHTSDKQNRTNIICFRYDKLEKFYLGFTVSDVIVYFLIPFATVLLRIRKRQTVERKNPEWNLSLYLAILYFIIQFPMEFYLKYIFFSGQENHYVTIFPILQTLVNCNGLGNAFVIVLQLKGENSSICCKKTQDYDTHQLAVGSLHIFVNENNIGAEDV